MKILDFPNLNQDNCYECGPKAIQAILKYYGVQVRKSRLSKLLGCTEDGTDISSIVQVLNSFGLKTVSKSMTIDDLIGFIDKDMPIIVPLQAWSDDPKPDYKKCWEDGHYVDVIGYDDDILIFMDPSIHQRSFLKKEDMVERWHDKGNDGKVYIQHGIAVYGKKPKYRSIDMIKME